MCVAAIMLLHVDVANCGCVILYSLNVLREKLFADFMVLSQAVKISTSKCLAKYTFSLRNTLSLQKIISK